MFSSRKLVLNISELVATNVEICPFEPYKIMIGCLLTLTVLFRKIEKTFTHFIKFEKMVQLFGTEQSKMVIRIRLKMILGSSAPMLGAGDWSRNVLSDKMEPTATFGRPLCHCGPFLELESRCGHPCSND